MLLSVQEWISHQDSVSPQSCSNPAGCTEKKHNAQHPPTETLHHFIHYTFATKKASKCKTATNVKLCESSCPQIYQFSELHSE